MKKLFSGLSVCMPLSGLTILPVAYVNAGLIRFGLSKQRVTV